MKKSKTVHIAELFVVPPVEVPACSSASGRSYLLAAVAPAVMQAMASQISEAREVLPLFSEVGIRDVELFRKFQHLFSAMENPALDIQVEGRCHELLCTLVETYSKSVSALSRI